MAGTPTSDRKRLQARRRQLREFLATARRDAGITQSELARRLGRPQSFVSKFENGERRLDVIELLEVAAALNAEPTRILSALNRQ